MEKRRAERQSGKMEKKRQPQKTEEKILFITTKNLDYIRNVQEIKLVKRKDPGAVIIGSYHKSYFLRLLKVWIQILFTDLKKFDIVWIGFAPQLVLPLFWKFRKKKVVIDFFISFYDTLCFDRRLVKAHGFLGKLLFLLDKHTLKVAHKVICDTREHQSYFLDQFQERDKEYITLYLEADSRVFYPRAAEKPGKLAGKYVVLYFGSILPLQGVKVILSAIELLKEEEDLHFIMIGPLEKKYKATAPKGANITYISWLSHKELAEYIAMADLCLAGHFQKDIQKACRTIPGKAYIYQAMKKNMILGDNKANREIFAEGEGITFVPMGDAKALAQAIKLQAGRGVSRQRKRR